MSYYNPYQTAPQPFAAQQYPDYDQAARHDPRPPRSEFAGPSRTHESYPQYDRHHRNDFSQSMNAFGHAARVDPNECSAPPGVSLFGSSNLLEHSLHNPYNNPHDPYNGHDPYNSHDLYNNHDPYNSHDYNRHDFNSSPDHNANFSQTSFGERSTAAADPVFAEAPSNLVSQENLSHVDQAAPSRTVYLGNLPSEIEPNELLDYVRSGILESVKILSAKNCAFISFIDLQSALLFHSDCILKKLNIKGNDIRIGWGKNSPIQPIVKEAIQKDGATRNVYLGNLHSSATGQPISEEELKEDLSVYGVIDCIKIIREKGIAFIHFLSILSAIKCVNNLPTKEKYLDKKCFYGKDRCAFITKTQQHNAAQYLGLAPGMEHVVTAADREIISSALVQQSAAAAQIATQAGGANNLGNRTVYLGNLHQDSSVEEICNVVRGGLLQSIRFLKERHVCFITFIDPIAAAQFFALCQLHGLTIHNRRIKVGWGKHSGPLSNALSLAVSNGASRNIYIGNINDFAHFNAQKLRDDFSSFGEIEQINYLEEKNCAFINFVNISNAIKAIDGIKSFKDYKTLKINFGKDRCGNLPRQFQNQSQHNSDIRQFGAPPFSEDAGQAMDFSRPM